MNFGTNIEEEEEESFWDRYQLAEHIYSSWSGRVHCRPGYNRPSGVDPSACTRGAGRDGAMEHTIDLEPLIPQPAPVTTELPQDPTVGFPSDARADLTYFCIIQTHRNTDPLVHHVTICMLRPSGLFCRHNVTGGLSKLRRQNPASLSTSFAWSNHDFLIGWNTKQ